MNIREYGLTELSAAELVATDGGAETPTALELAAQLALEAARLAAAASMWLSKQLDLV